VMLRAIFRLSSLTQASGSASPQRRPGGAREWLERMWIARAGSAPFTLFVNDHSTS
jgi:hypothetical protein